jgi:hypothetical protein
MKLGEGIFKLLMNSLCSTNEPDRGEAKAVFVEALFRGGDYLGVVGKAQIVIGTEVEDFTPIDPNMSRLR